MISFESIETLMNMQDTYCISQEISHTNPKEEHITNGYY